ncbi:alpha-amylase family glycosyl hydrolase [Kordiimonas lacus]|uniref:Glycosidase n=1 Tax=Kordiimonas lacus TaxID=637679 RepID=A0A1G7A5A7_9PROT|nr:alpha-amylase family glycosyl hydrolase [Kordiimonas lacus]SDE10029.1 Glycosidase [Kordiimonas lacus]
MKFQRTNLAAFGLALTLLSGCDQADKALPPEEPITVRPELLEPYISRPITDDVMYFVMPDRFNNGDPSNDTGGFGGDATTHGFDPTHKGFFHGGDFKGLTEKLDYLADMGVSAIWMTPIFKNKPVQGNPVNMTAAYHGYWITDFTQIDPHLGTNDDLKTLVDEAHKRNMKVIFDIITNHTADVIKYEECFPRGSDPANVPLCDYRSKEAFPYTTKGGPDGEAINAGFLGDDPEHQTKDNFDKLTALDYAYTPYVPAGEEDVKVPAWLNDMRYYHNRGDSEWQGESSLYGDFAGLDDLFTEHPDVKEGFIDIYKFWISEFKIDGFRIDTVKHVNDSFWQTFAPAITAHAEAEGIPNFYMFGEVYEPTPERLSHFTNEAKVPFVLDFAFQSAAYQMFSENKGPQALAETIEKDTLYQPVKGDARSLPIFLGNHDMGRIAHFIRRGNPDESPEASFKKDLLAHALMFYSRGVPVIYYGDEQGFIGDGHDQDAREDMFVSQVASYADNDLLGTEKSSAEDNFDVDHPLYQAMQRFTMVKRAHPALRHGKMTFLHADSEPGLLVFERTDETTGDTVLAVFNTSAEVATASVPALEGPLCFIDGTAGETGEAYTAPALSWALFKPAACEG